MTWGNPAYKYKKRIIINFSKVSGDEINFPVLLSVTDTDLKTVTNGGHVENASGFDICFYDSTENILLYHELESFAAATGVVVFWVNIPSISSTSNTFFYMYYGNSAISTTQSSTSTWDTNFKAVYHQTATTTLLDSTINDKDSTAYAATVATIAGQIDGALDYRPSGYFTLPAIYASAPSAFSIECWFNPDIVTSDDGVFAKNAAGDYSPCLVIMSSIFSFVIKIAATTYQPINKAISTGSWYYVVVTYDDADDTIHYYFQGSQYDSDATVGGTATINTTMWMGCYENTTHTFDGKIDETRFSAVQRSANWILTSYTNQNAPTTFLSSGDELYLLKLEKYLESKVYNSRYSQDVYLDTDKNAGVEKMELALAASSYKNM